MTDEPTQSTSINTPEDWTAERAWSTGFNDARRDIGQPVNFAFVPTEFQAAYRTGFDAGRQAHNQQQESDRAGSEQ